MSRLAASAVRRVRAWRWLALACGVVAALLVTVPAQAAAPRIGHDGRWLTDAQGRVVILHGINMVDKRPPYAPDAVGFGEDDAAFLADQGFNAVRLGVIYAAVEPAPGVYDDAYLARIEQTVRMLDQHGIVSLLDFHQDLYSETFKGEGWPAWAVQDDGLPNEDAGFPFSYFTNTALQRAYDNFWANAPGPGGVGLMDRYAAAWAHVATRFADVPGVLGYDLMNEPWPGTHWQTCGRVTTGCKAFDATLTRFSRKTIAAIRAVDEQTLAFYEPNTGFNLSAPTHLGKIGDPHAAMSFHDYCPSAPSVCSGQDDTVLRNAIKRSADTGDATLMTEFGATDSPAVLKPMVQRADRFEMGWMEWHYCACADPTGADDPRAQALVIDPTKPPSGANLKRAKAAILTRPYPQAIAGTPQGWALNVRNSHFVLRYATGRAKGQPTIVAVPPRVYPRGYSATAAGAKIVSAPGAAQLVLTACPGARHVRLVITPGKGEHDTC
jgi:endoglycosylceramidase